ncbi:MAG: hypothetical protein WCT37_03760 [Patescibacteria group bacterium]|jgi:hypothetical protein
MADDIKLNSLLDFPELLKLKAEDLLLPGNLELIRASIKENPEYICEFSKNRELARHFSALIQPTGIFSTKPGLLKEYQALVNYLNYQRLPVMVDKDIWQMFKAEAVEILASGVDLKERLLLYFDLNGTETEAGRFFLANLIKNFRENQEKIGQVKLTINNIEAEPTVSNWLKSYELFFESGREHNALGRVSYLGNSPQVRQLNPAEKGILTALLEFYDELKYPQAAPEVIGRRTVAVSAPARPMPTEKASPLLPAKSAVTPRPVKPVADFLPPRQLSRDEILRLYQGDAAENEAVATAVASLKNTASGNFRKLCDDLFLLLQSRQADKVEIVALLTYLAQLEKLDDLIKEDQRFYRLVADDLKQKGEEQMLNDLKFYPQAPQFLRWLLAGILGEKLKLKENEAARIGLKLGNLLKQAGNDKYAGMAYFDAVSGEFKWKK